MNRASRTGPFAEMNGGIVFVAPSSVATAICGFGTGTCGLKGAGLVPPTEGCAWHAAQLLALNVGPKPTPASPGKPPDTESTSLKRSLAAVKNVCSVAFRVANGPPAPAAPGREPDSV